MVERCTSCVKLVLIHNSLQQGGTTAMRISLPSAQVQHPFDTSICFNRSGSELDAAHAESASLKAFKHAHRLFVQRVLSAKCMEKREVVVGGLNCGCR